MVPELPNMLVKTRVVIEAATLFTKVLPNRMVEITRSMCSCSFSTRRARRLPCADSA